MSRLLWKLLVLLMIVPLSCARQEKGPLNVLFIAVDDLNNDLGTYGHDLVQSPNIDELAARGVRFEHAYSQYPVCNPSRSSFLTGLYPDQSGVLSNAGNFRIKNPNLVTLPQLFRQNGYYVARVGKLYHYGVPLGIGTNGEDDSLSWDEVVNPKGIDRDSLHLVHTIEEGKYGGTLSWLNIESEDEDHTDGIGVGEAIRLLEENHPDKTGRPFFLGMGFYRPHTPYVAPSSYFSLYDRDAIEPVMEVPGDRDDIPAAALHDRPKQRELTVAQRKEIIEAYFASISFTDAQVGKLIDALDRLDLADNTVIVFVSDHGYHLGAHGLWQKSDLFEGSVRVPLLIATPGMSTAGLASSGMVELVDLYPTLADICGLAPPDHLMGRSLRPVLDDPALSVRETALSVTVSRGAIVDPSLRGQRIKGYTIRSDRYRYTEWGEGAYGMELYDYEVDPIEYTNLANFPEYEPLRDSLKAVLQERVRGAR